MTQRAAVIAVALAAAASFCSRTALAQEPEEGRVHVRVPVRIDSVVPVKTQPPESAKSTIWYDDFDDDDALTRYAEHGGKLTARERVGSAGMALEMRYTRGTRGRGGCKVFFGDSPTYAKHTVHADRRFDDVYWRVYVKHQAGWTGGGPAKLSRATSLVPPGWRQAMIAHVWSTGEALTLDPASGVRDGEVVTTKYNDFDNLSWLGNKPASKFQIHSTKESGRWVCVEARARLNRPGKKDGLQQLWIDGRLESERTGLDWRGTFDERRINAVFLEAYWNAGSPVDQSRWIDEFVIATEPIGPLVCPRTPTLRRTPTLGRSPAGDDANPAWEVEVAMGANVPRDADGEDVDVVWRSAVVKSGEAVNVATTTGKYMGSRSGHRDLAPGATHFVRVRAAGTDAAWSKWHQPFVTE